MGRSNHKEQLANSTANNAASYTSHHFLAVLVVTDERGNYVRQLLDSLKLCNCHVAHDRVVRVYWTMKLKCHFARYEVHVAANLGRNSRG